MAAGAGSAPEAPPARATGSPQLLAAAESAEAVWVGVVRAPTRVDLHGWTARLEVQRVLQGPEAADRPRIAWEELAPGRPARFSEGERVLVALDPMPGQSLWRSRFPDGQARVVAGRGRAFLRDPDPASLDALTRYLSLAPAERRTAAGLPVLAALVADAAPTLAAGALARLGSRAGLAAQLDGSALARLASTLGDEGRPLELRRDLADLAGTRRIRGLRPALQRAALEDAALAPAAWQALAEIDGGLPEARLAALGEAADPALRAVAARHSPGTALETRLVETMRSDPAAAVRAAAVEAWVEARGLDGLEAALPALSDRDAAVQAAAARVLGELGGPAVPTLRARAAERAGRDAAGALAALSFAGPEGRAALAELAHAHPDERTRALARLALGRDPHVH